MSRKMIYTLTLFVFIVMWGVFGLAAAPPARAEPALQDTLAPTVVVPTVVVTTVVNQTVIAPAIGVTRDPNSG